MSLAKTTFAFLVQKLTGAAAVVTIASIMPTTYPDGTKGQPTYAMMVNDANQGTAGTIRWTADGVTTPSSTVGTPLQTGGELDFDGPLTNLQFYIPNGTILWINFFA